MDKVAMHVLVSGHVQGVFYRQSTLEQAKVRGIAGWVRNLADGRVEALLVGSRNGVLDLETWMNQGPAMATVAEVHAEWVSLPEEDLQDFVVR